VAQPGDTSSESVWDKCHKWPVRMSQQLPTPVKCRTLREINELINNSPAPDARLERCTLFDRHIFSTCVPGDCSHLTGLHVTTVPIFVRRTDFGNSKVLERWLSSGL
jgi:hypothetical protein